LAIVPSYPQLLSDRPAAALHLLALCDGLLVVADEIREGPADRVSLLDPEHARGRGVEERRLAVLVAGPDALGGGLDDPAEAPLRLPPQLALVLHGGHVRKQAKRGGSLTVVTLHGADTEQAQQLAFLGPAEARLERRRSVARALQRAGDDGAIARVDEVEKIAFSDLGQLPPQHVADLGVRERCPSLRIHQPHPLVGG
jgi:hypothetical protein